MAFKVCTSSIMIKFIAMFPDVFLSFSKIVNYLIVRIDNLCVLTSSISGNVIKEDVYCTVFEKCVFQVRKYKIQN